MRVLYFSRGYTPHDYRFLSSLASTGHEVFYLRLEYPQRQVEDRPVPSEVQQIPWVGTRAFRWFDIPRLRKALGHILAGVQPDLVHAGPIQSCAFLVALTGFRPLLTMSWGYDLMQDADRSLWSRSVTGYTLRRSNFFVSDAVVTRDRAVAYGMDRSCTAVFPWGVDLKHFRPAKPARPRTPAPAVKSRASSRKKPFTILCTRSWEPLYRVDLLARAFVRLAQARPEARLLLMGGDSMAQPIRQILASGGVLDRAQFPGQVSHSDLPRWYHMADLYVSPSHIDGSSVSLMEALACGLPVLVSDIPGNLEWITSGDNGWTFPDGNVDALAAAILHAINSRQQLPAIARRARQTAEARANWPRNFAVLMDAYERTIRAVS